MIVLGSGSPLPDPERAGPSTLVRTGRGDLLFDCGRGVLMRAAAAGSGAAALRGLFLTHLHSDHTPISTTSSPRGGSRRSSPTPARLRAAGDGDAASATEAMLELDIGYRWPTTPTCSGAPSADVVECERGRVLAERRVRVTAAPTDTRPVRPTVGYRVDEGGASVVIAGDTVPCAGLDELCAGPTCSCTRSCGAT